MADYYSIVVARNQKLSTGAEEYDAYDFIGGFVTASKRSRWTKDDGTRTITIHVPFALLAEDQTITLPLSQLLGKRIGPDTEAELLERYGTAYYKKQVANQEVLTAARATLGGIVPQDPPDTSHVDMSKKPSDVMTDMLAGGGPGVCLGRSHGEAESLAALGEAIDGGGAGLLFVEEFLTDEQADLDAYLAPANADPDNFKFGVLPERLDQLRNTHKVDWAPVLKKAKAQGMKIYGIDSGEGREYAGPLTTAINSGVPGAADSMGERRVSGMNKVTYDVMDAAIRDPANAGKKFLAVVGAKHSNTHEGGVPGVSQMFGCVAVRLDPENPAVLKRDAENKALRGMPPLDEQLYVDYAMVDAAKRNPQLSPEILRKEALAQAKLLKSRNQLPSADEQIFIANYVQQAQRNPALAGKDAELLRNAALKEAKAKTANGDLPPVGPVSALVDGGAMGGQVAAVETLLRDIKTAIDGNDAPTLKTLLQNNPTALTLKDDKGRSVLQLAVDSRRTPLVAAVCEKWPDAARVDPPDPDGDNALHQAVRGRPGNDGAKTAQAALVQALIAGGAPVNRGNRDGATALHLVGKTDNEKASEKLLAAGADVGIKDARGWTALDAAIAGTSVSVEKMYYDQGKAVAAENHDNATTIERLMKATMCENPADAAKVRAAYEKLYMVPELQPLLRLGALAASNPRNPPQPDSAPRVVIAAGTSVKNLYAQPPGQQQQYPQGAFDEGGGVVMVSNDSANDFAGVLIHEMTHMATQVMYGSEVEPYDPTDAVAKQAYIDAIQADMKAVHLLSREDPMEAKIKERLSGRMLKYATDGRPNDKGLLQEFIVGVPQLIAEFGPDAVRRFAPNLYAQFASFSRKCGKEADESPRYDDARDWLDDSILHLPQPTFEASRPPHEQVAKPGCVSLQIDEIIKTVKADYLAKHGDVQPTVGTIAFDESSFTLTDPARMQVLDKKLRKVKEGLLKSLDPKHLTLPVSNDELRKLIQQTADLTQATAEKDLEKATEASVGRWLVQAKVDYVSKKAFSGEPMTDIELAETIALNAEDQSGQGSSGFDFDVNPDKHAQLVAKLATDLGKLSPDKKSDPAKQGVILDAVVSKLTGSKAAGVYHKTAGRFSRKQPDPRHVSIDVKNARRRWVQELNKL